MKDFKRYFKPVFILSFCAVLLVAGWLYFQNSGLITLKADQFVQEKAALERLLQNSSEIQRIWIEGEDSKEWGEIKSECLKANNLLNDFDESLLRCHPLVLQCLNQYNKKLNYRLVSPLSQFGDKKLYRYVTKSNSSYLGIDQSGYLFAIEDLQSKKRLSLILSDQCHEIYLQNRAYAYGEELVEDDYRFDNFNQNIYIDQNMVTNSDINEWIDFGNSEFTRGIEKKDGEDLFLPATKLTMNQMMDYCSFRGKQLLLAHYFDAATFLPMDLTELIPKKNSRSPYYWTKKKSEFKEDCNYLYANECLSKKAFRLNATSPTWTGLMDAMGGVFESFRNPIDPESNLKASSMYFNFKSPWHKLGFRAGWDGEGFDLRHFDFKGLNPMVTPEKFQVGFRCMREAK